MLSFFLVLLSNILFAASSILLTLAYAHMGGFEEAASLGVAFAVCSPLQLFFSMQHGVSIISGKTSWEDALSIRLVLLIPFLFLSAIVSWLIDEPLVFVFSLFRVGDFLYEPFFYFLIKNAYSLWLFFEVLGRFILLVFAWCVLFYYGFDIFEIVFTLAILNFSFVSLRYGLVKRGRGLNFRWTGEHNYFLGVSALLVSVSVNVPRYVLPASEAGDLAAYSNMLTLCVGGTLFFGSLNNVLFAKNSKEGWNGVFDFLNISLALSMLGFFISFFFVFFDGLLSEMFILLFFGDGYIAYSGLVFGFSVFYFILYLQNSLNYAYVYAGFHKLFTIGSAFLLVLLFLSAYIAVNLGLGVGVVWVMVILNLFFCLAMFLLFKYKVRRLI